VATIERIEITLVDLPPKAGAPSPAGATAAGREAEAVVVRVADADGETGTGYACTAGTGGSSVVRLLHDHLAPDLIGRDADLVEDAWRFLLARAGGAGRGRDRLAGAGRGRHRLVGPALPPRRAAAPPHGRRRAGGRPALRGGGRRLDLAPEELAERAVVARERGFGGFSVAVGKPSVAEDAARLEAARAAVGAGFELMAEARHAFALDEAAAALGASSRSTSPGWPSPCRPATPPATPGSPPARACRSPPAARSTASPGRGVPPPRRLRRRPRRTRRAWAGSRPG
jgi:L-alanine-DL-glutamate epimerase-like enolase superfamily enzyme